ncbi:MAG: hypothetical protein ABWJ42_01055 [Sulfolobales archaeon]
MTETDIDSASNTSDIVILLLAVSTIFLSTFIHGVLLEYSDIYSILLDRSRGDTVYGVPYVDFRFEYPPFVGFLWALSSYLTRIIQTQDPVKTHMYVLFVLNALFYALYVYTVVELSAYVRSGLVRILLSIASFSMVYYLMYNWDIVAISLALLSLLYLFRERYTISSIILSLSILTKLLTAPLYLSILYYSYKRGLLKEGVRGIIISLFIILGSISSLMIISPRFYEYFIEYHSNWYCENCFYILFTDNIWDPSLRIVSISLMLLSPLLVTLSIASGDCDRDLYLRSYSIGVLSTALMISFSYVYSPQMNIMIMPLYMILSRRTIPIMLASDLLNTLIMILWFRTDIFTSLGLSSPSPHFRTSPIQWIAFSRIILLWIVVFSLVVGFIRTRVKT